MFTQEKGIVLGVHHEIMREEPTLEAKFRPSAPKSVSRNSKEVFEALEDLGAQAANRLGYHGLAEEVESQRGAALHPVREKLKTAGFRILCHASVKAHKEKIVADAARECELVLAKVRKASTLIRMAKGESFLLGIPLVLVVAASITTIVFTQLGFWPEAGIVLGVPFLGVVATISFCAWVDRPAWKEKRRSRLLSLFEDRPTLEWAQRITGEYPKKDIPPHVLTKAIALRDLGIAAWIDFTQPCKLESPFEPELWDQSRSLADKLAEMLASALEAPPDPFLFVREVDGSPLYLDFWNEPYTVTFEEEEASDRVK